MNYSYGHLDKRIVRFIDRQVGLGKIDLENVFVFTLELVNQNNGTMALKLIAKTYKLDNLYEFALVDIYGEEKKPWYKRLFT